MRVRSDAFRAGYAARRQAERPPDLPETTAARTDLDKGTAKMDKAMAETRAALANMPPEMRKMMEETMKAAGAGGGDWTASWPRCRSRARRQ